MSKPEFDENGVEKPQGYLFGKIPYYSNRHEGATGWAALTPWLMVIPIVIALNWSEIKAMF